MVRHARAYLRAAEVDPERGRPDQHVYVDAATGELCFANKDEGEKAVGTIGSSVASDNMATDAGIDSYQKFEANAEDDAKGCATTYERYEVIPGPNECVVLSEPAIEPLGAALSLGAGHEGKRRSTKVYNVLADKCIGCGTCAVVCPTGTVKLVNGKPIWGGEHCIECLRCLHFCPENTSQHGKVTEGRKRYLNPILERP